jgi:aminoglycoside phosphotransferase
MIARDILRKLPDTFAAEIAGLPATPVTAGMSGADVFRLRTKPSRFLKVAEADAAEELRKEIVRTEWLASRGIRVAPILRTHTDGPTVAMLTEALPGTPADRSNRPQTWLLSAIGRAVARLHELPATECPFDESLDVRLARAQRAIARREIDASHFASRNRDRTPEDLYQDLAANRPAEDLVVAQGDLTLSNMVIGTDGSVGFVDCGHAGRADRYLDLGVLAAEIVDRFGSDAPAVFARAYGAQNWDRSKAAYFSDLYELF